MPIPDLTFHEALRRRLGRLTPAERAIILAECLRVLRAHLSRLTLPQQRALALQIAAALDAAGCYGEAAALRLSVGGGPPAGRQERRHRGRRWSDPIMPGICPTRKGGDRRLY